MIEQLLGIVVFCCAVFAILEGARRFLLFISRLRGREPMATYVDRWPVTRA